MISYGKQTIDQSDIDAVVESLNSDWLTQGPRVKNLRMIYVYCLAHLIHALCLMAQQRCTWLQKF